MPNYHYHIILPFQGPIFSPSAPCLLMGRHGNRSPKRRRCCPIRISFQWRPFPVPETFFHRRDRPAPSLPLPVELGGQRYPAQPPHGLESRMGRCRRRPEPSAPLACTGRRPRVKVTRSGSPASAAIAAAAAGPRSGCPPPSAADWSPPRRGRGLVAPASRRRPLSINGAGSVRARRAPAAPVHVGDARAAVSAE